jgi:DNA-binding transcriptional LysR family regulator
MEQDRHQIIGAMVRGVGHCSANGRRITMQMQQVQYFLALCEELNFSRAARRRGVSQPTLTTAIRALERELGGALFHRKPSIALTELGRLVRPYLNEIVRNADHAREVARRLTPHPVADRSARQAVDSSELPSNRSQTAGAWQ